MNRSRAADDFAAVRARMEELRRERVGVRASDRDLQLDPLVRRGRIERWSAGETTAGPGRVRQSSSGTQPDREGPRGLGASRPRTSSGQNPGRPPGSRSSGLGGLADRGGADASSPNSARIARSTRMRGDSG